MSLNKLGVLANKYDDEVIWDFLKSKSITKENLTSEMQLTTIINPCMNSECKMSDLESADIYFSGFESVGYFKNENRFIDTEDLSDEELENMEIEELDNFQLYYCQECGSLNYFIE